MMSTFDFAWPLVLAALVLVPLIAVFAWRGERRRAAADALYGGPDDLRVGRSRALRGLRVVLLLLALAILIIGVARPRWGAEEAEVQQRGIDIVLSVDVSRSMEAEDVRPMRAEAVSSSLQEMLTHLHGNRVGMVIFGDTALARAPLSLDVDAIGSLVARAQGEGALVEPGTSLAVGIDAALDVLEVDDPAHAQAIVLASDGEDLSGIEFTSAIERARERGVPVYGLFSGSGEPTALSTAGAEDVTTADRSTMETIAEGTGAEVREPGSVAGLAVDFRRMRQTEFEAGAEQVATERFPWFLGVALGLLLFQSLVPEATRARGRRPRRGAVAVGVAGGLLLVAGCSGTAIWQHVERGNEAFQEGRYDDALEAYEDARMLNADGEHTGPIAFNAGNALHQLERYPGAVEAALEAIGATEAAADVATMRYAVGNHHFRDDELTAARDAYVNVLRYDPDHQEAKANLELVLEALRPDEPDPAELPDEEQPDLPPGDEPGDGEGDGEGDAEADPDAQNGNGDEPAPPDDPADSEPNGDEGDPLDPSDAGEPGPGEPGGEAGTTPFDDALEELEARLGEIGEELTTEEALELLELHRRLAELDRLPDDSIPGDTVPPR